MTRRGQSIDSLLITSAIPGEGKTFIAANLAMSMAQNGYRTILVDANMRNPGLHQLFDVPQEPGFTNLIYDQRDDIGPFLKPAMVENLWLLTSGTLLPNSADLLGSPQVTRLMQQLAAHADIVIYDTPAIASVTDAVTIAPRVDAVFQVVMAGRSRIDKIRGARMLLEHAGSNILGPVLNRVKKLPRTGYYTPHQRSSQSTSTSQDAAAQQPGLVPSLLVPPQKPEQIVTSKTATDTE
jgi:capsular exopolysaccharide synthesis family protein